jgi:plasmid maintenance system antidote protein VapI
MTELKARGKFETVFRFYLERAGVVAQSTLSQILAGKRGVSEGTAKKLGAFFGVSSTVFL